MSGFPAKSGKTRAFTGRRGLTGGLPDVGTGRVFLGGVIRLALRPFRREKGPSAAFKTPSLRISPVGPSCRAYGLAGKLMARLEISPVPLEL
jgi:hypothetical protein